MNTRQGVLLSLCGFAVLFGAVALTKVVLSHGAPAHARGGERWFYPSESALQYRWAERIAGGEALPRLDTRVQHPEGLRFWRDELPVMEHLAGYTWRFLFGPLTGISFFRYSIWFVAFVSSLPLAVIFWGGWVLAGSWRVAWAAALLYAFHPLNYVRVAGNFGRENFALGFIFLAVVALLWAWRARRGNMAPAAVVLAAAAQSVAFASWHLSRPAFTIVAAGLFLLVYTGRLGARQQWLVGLWFLLLIPACLLIPALRERWFLFSPGMILGAAVLADVLLRDRWQHALARRGVLALVAVVLVLLAPRGDSHVMAVALDKIRFLGEKPADPGLLHVESRLMWVDDFESPGVGRSLYYFLPMLPALALAVAAGLSGCRLQRRDESGTEVGEPRAEGLLLLALTAAFGLIFLMFFRLQVLFLFFPALLIGWGLGVFSLRGRVAAWGALAAVAVAAGLGLWQTITTWRGNPLQRVLAPVAAEPATRFLPTRGDNIALLEWIESETGSDDVFVGWFGLMAAVHAQTDRPVVIQPKFENDAVRVKTVEFMEALFSAPGVMEDFCRRYEADYVIYEPRFLLDDTQDSLRYKAGAMQLSEDSTATAMHFFPHDLENHELVYQSRSYRIYRFLSDPDEPFLNLPIAYEPVYDRGFFGVERRTPIDEVRIMDGAAEVSDLYTAYAFAVGELAAGRFDTAQPALLSIVSRCPNCHWAWLRLGELAEATGNANAAAAAYHRALDAFPASVEAEGGLRRLGER